MYTIYSFKPLLWLSTTAYPDHIPKLGSFLKTFGTNRYTTEDDDGLDGLDTLDVLDTLDTLDTLVVEEELPRCCVDAVDDEDELVGPLSDEEFSVLLDSLLEDKYSPSMFLNNTTIADFIVSARSS